MTPKEKAEKLYSKFYEFAANPDIDNVVNKNNVKECALICCNEVLGYMGSDRGSAFWEKVKEEINKL